MTKVQQMNNLSNLMNNKCITKAQQMNNQSDLNKVYFNIRAGNSNLTKSRSVKSSHSICQNKNPPRGLLSLQNCQS